MGIADASNVIANVVTVATGTDDVSNTHCYCEHIVSTIVIDFE
jgi:hypothetical protein